MDSAKEPDAVANEEEVVEQVEQGEVRDDDEVVATVAEEGDGQQEGAQQTQVRKEQMIFDERFSMHL